MYTFLYLLICVSVRSYVYLLNYLNAQTKKENKRQYNASNSAIVGTFGKYPWCRIAEDSKVLYCFGIPYSEDIWFPAVVICGEHTELITWKIINNLTNNHLRDCKTWVFLFSTGRSNYKQIIPSGLKKKEFSGTNLREPFKCRLTNIFYFIIYAEQQQTMFLRRYLQKHNDLFLLL